MNTDKIIKAIEKWNETSKEPLIWAKDLTKDQRNNMLESFVIGGDTDEWIAMFDRSFGKKGKKAYLFTGTKLYGKKLKEPIDFTLLEDIRYEYPYRIWQIYKDGRVEAKLDSDVCIDLEKILPLLQDITGTNQAYEPPKTKYEYVRQNYHRELKRRLRPWIQIMKQKNDEVQCIENCSQEFIQNAIGTLPNVTEDQLVTILASIEYSGKKNLLITLDGMYSSYLYKDQKFQLDGLEKIHVLGDGKFLLIYENGYVDRVHFPIKKEKDEEFAELISGILSIYQQLQEEVQSGSKEHFGLDVTAGWAAFEQKRKENALDTYKNSVFVSSTFRDMHFERDIIHEKVQPSLNALAEQYGESLSFCDLRWGVNTEELDSEEGAKKVLIVCLDEIERCDPYMLILLGERYGWIPNENTVKNALEGRPEFVLDELEKSVTALEIEFGALTKDTPKERIFVYFREMKNAPSEVYGSEDEHHAQKLAELKARVKKLVPDRVKTYQLSWNEGQQSMDGIDAFAQLVTEDIGTVMEKEWKSRTKKSSLEEEFAQHWSYAEKKAAMCYARDAFLQTCLKHLDENDHLLALQGISGCGKSTVMGALAVILQASNAEVLPLFCGHTERTNAATQIVQHIVYYLEELLRTTGKKPEEPTQQSVNEKLEEPTQQSVNEKPEEPTHQNASKSAEELSEEVWIARMNQLVEQYSKEKDNPVIILIDAVDQLTADAVRNNLKFIPDHVSSYSSKVNVIISCLDDFELPGVPVIHQVPLLTEEKKPIVISGVLNRNRRELDRTVIDAITKKKASDSPLYLSLLIQRLLMMNKNDFDDIASEGDGMSAITQHQLKLIAKSGDTISAVCQETIEMAAERIGGGFVKAAIACILTSRYGLRESDLEGILRGSGISWNRLEFSLFINYVRNIFVLREDGCYDFSHKIIRQELTELYGNTLDSHKRIFSWLLILPKQDHLRAKELLYHCVEAEDRDAFISLIQEMTENDEDTTHAAKDIVARCYRDGGEWLARVLDKVTSDQIEIEYKFFAFFAYPVINSFYNIEPDLSIRERLAKPLLQMARYLRTIRPDMDSQRAVGVMYNRLGNIYYRKGDTKALEYFQAALDETHALAERFKEDKIYADLSLDMRALANVYDHFGGEENLQQARWHYEKSIEMAEKVCEYSNLAYAKKTLGWSYQKMADFCYNQKEYDKAQTYYQASAKVREQLVADEPTEVNIDNLCNSYGEIAQGCKEEQPLKALEYYEKIISHREGLVRENRTQSNLQDLAWAYSWAGYFLYKESSKTEHPKALVYLEKCIPVFEDALKKKDNSYMLWTLCNNYSYVVQLLIEQGGADIQSKLDSTAEKGLCWHEHWAKKEDENRVYISWIALLHTYARVTQNKQRAKSCLEKAVELYELMYQRTKDKEYKKSMRLTKVLIGGTSLLRKMI